MKKVIISIFLIFSLFIGIDKISAKEVQSVCHYKTGDGKINMAVLNYGDGSAKAYLTNPFTKSDGFREDQTLGASWDVKNFSKSTSCDQYLLFSLKSGSNSLTAQTSKPTSGDNEYILQNYDFDSGASKCKYQGQYRNTLVNLTLWVNGKSVFYNYDNANKETDDNFENVMGEYKYPNPDIAFGTDSVGPADRFYGEFIDSFYASNGEVSCPSLYTVKSTGGVNFFSATTGSGNAFKLIDSSYAGNVDVGKIAAEFRVNFSMGEKQKQKVDFLFRVYESKKEEICMEVDNTISNCIKLPITSKQVFQQNVWMEGEPTYRFVSFSIDPAEIGEFFVYDDINDPSTLRDPAPVYFNNVMSYAYEISKTEGKHAIEGDAESIVSGKKYQDLVKKLCPYLTANDKFDNSLTVNPLNNKQLITLPGCSAYTGDMNDLEYHTETTIKEIGNYCTNLYSSYSRYKEFVGIKDRINECIDFDLFYNNLINGGVIKDLGSDCGFITPALKEKIVFILDIIKIAAPIIALALSTLDFIKTIAAGDADKEMKSAFKRFMIRIGSAVLLFVIPVILAFLLDLFVGNQEGYNEDNPFCDVIEWGDLK